MFSDVFPCIGDNENVVFSRDNVSDDVLCPTIGKEVFVYVCGFVKQVDIQVLYLLFIFRGEGSCERVRRVQFERDTYRIMFWRCAFFIGQTCARPKCRIDDASVAVFNEALTSGRAIVFLTPHLGCYEVGPMMVAERWLKGSDRQFAILYRVPRKSYLRDIVGKGRVSENIVPASADLKGVRQILKIMKAGGIAGILPDQVPSHGEGVWAPLFGEKAYTMTFPLKLARQFKAQVIMARMQREAEGWCMYVKGWDYVLSGDEKKDAEAMNQFIEETILCCPQQYLWSYKRYKCPRGVKREQ